MIKVSVDWKLSKNTRKLTQGRDHFSDLNVEGTSLTVLLLRPTNRKHIQEWRQNQCSDCGKKLFSLGSLKGHQKIHTGEKPFRCPECERSFLYQPRLRLHQIHTGEKPYCSSDCVKCDAYKMGVQVHRGKTVWLHCRKNLSARPQLTQHHQSHHTEKKQYHCVDCGKSFGNKTILLRHQQGCPSDQKQQHCSFLFKSKSIGYTIKQASLWQITAIETLYLASSIRGKSTQWHSLDYLIRKNNSQLLHELYEPKKKSAAVWNAI